MKITVPSYNEYTLTSEQMKEISKAYCRIVLGGKDYYVTEEGRLEDWTSWPHGSGTTTDHGLATEKQKAAYALLKLL